MEFDGCLLGMALSALAWVCFTGLEGVGYFIWGLAMFGPVWWLFGPCVATSAALFVVGVVVVIVGAIIVLIFGTVVSVVVSVVVSSVVVVLSSALGEAFLASGVLFGVAAFVTVDFVSAGLDEVN